VAARDKRRTDIAKFLEALKPMRIPAGTPAEQAIWVILARHGTKEGATRACGALWERYLSVNEFRVAKVTEIAELIEKHVKNDPRVAAEQARGFLRRYFTEFQMVDPAATEVKPPHELKKYLHSIDSHGRAIALMLALYYCQRELEEQAIYAVPSDDGKPKKRPEKELTASANRMRLLFSYSAHGTVTPKEAHSGKAFVRSWAYKPLPAQKKVAKKAKKKAPAKAAKKAPAKKTTRKAAKKKARTKATRTTRKRVASKKSSRR